MTARASDATRSARRRWAVVLLLSALFHVAILGAFALRLPAMRPDAAPRVMNVALVEPPPFARLTPTAPRPPPRSRVVVLDTAPRYVAPPEAPTGEARDAADLFGPVFADGLWPRPALVRSEPCDPEDEPARAADCRRELVLIGLASEAEARSKARP